MLSIFQRLYYKLQLRDFGKKNKFGLIVQIWNWRIFMSIDYIEIEVHKSNLHSLAHPFSLHKKIKECLKLKIYFYSCKNLYVFS